MILIDLPLCDHAGNPIVWVGRSTPLFTLFHHKILVLHELDTGRRSSCLRPVSEPTRS